jgi:hypothetical protein
MIFNQRYKSYEATQNTSIFIPSLESSLYLLKVETAKAVEVKKIVIERN